MKDSSQEMQQSPGLILRAARDELKFSVDHVAHELHLRSSVVKAMEEEDYEQFNSDVFLKGYFRSYCRLVNLHEERMIELLDKQLCSRKQEREDAALQLKKLGQAKSRKKAFSIIAVVAFIVCVGGVGYSYTGNCERSHLKWVKWLKWTLFRGQIKLIQLKSLFRVVVS